MQEFFHFLEVLASGLIGLAALFIILLALPKSKLRSLLLEVLGWGGAAVSAVGLVSPVDIIPDVIPIAGQLDDIGYLILGILSALVAYFERKKRLDKDSISIQVRENSRNGRSVDFE